MSSKFPINACRKSYAIKYEKYRKWKYETSQTFELVVKIIVKVLHDAKVKTQSLNQILLTVSRIIISIEGLEEPVVEEKSFVEI